MDEPSIVKVPDPPPPPGIPPPPASYNEHRDASTPLIIDNGTTSLRWGFATSESPTFGPNVIAKYKERRTLKPLLLFGDGIDVESGARAQARYPWETDVLLNFDALENALDYAFLNLGIDTPTVNHPIMMTERLCSPLHSRALTSELIFELYSAPSLTFCNDAMMSFYKNTHAPSPDPFNQDGLVISFNAASTSVIPILSGKGIMSHAKRIPWGTTQASDYLLKLIQLKYPNFPTRMTSPQATWMLHNFTSFATDYTALMRKMADPLEIRAAEQVIQFPYSKVGVTEEKTEEELAERAERRKEMGKRLQEMAAEKRLEALMQKEKDLTELIALRESHLEDDENDWTEKLTALGFEDDDELDETIKKLESDLKKARKKEIDVEESTEEPSFPLVDVPDEDLDESQLKEKKKQKLLKSGYEARLKARKEKEKEREERALREKEEADERELDLDGWSRRMRSEQEALMTKIKDRARRKAELGDRKSAAAQARMKNIANLAADDAKMPRKKRKTNGDDMFGADDADWAIYRKIQSSARAPSSDEEDDLAQLGKIEEKLLTHDPTFSRIDTHAFISSQRSALMNAFKPAYEEGDVEGATRIHLNTERWRVCEAWFSPGMAGVDSAGLGEVVHSILQRFGDEDKGRLVKNVFLTGTPSKFPNLIPRLHAMMRPILPPEMEIVINRANDPTLDAWRGMAAFSLTDGFKETGVTREEYLEEGGERLRRWWGGNWNGGVIGRKKASA